MSEEMKYKRFELKCDTHRSKDCKIFIDGEEINGLLRSVRIEIDADKNNTVFLEILPKEMNVDIKAEVMKNE